MARKQRQHGERFVSLTHDMLKSEAWRLMSPQAKAVYLELCRRFNGRNNGEISYSVREAEHIGLAKSIAARALASLEGLANHDSYMADLDHEITVVRSADVGAAVTEIATLRAQLSGPQVG